MWWDQWNNFGSRPYFPFLVGLTDDQGNLKEDNDFYHVYVNGDYVGDKVIIAQGDSGPDSVQEFLRSRGFENYNMHLEGNRINIYADGDEEAEQIKKHLSVYLSIR
ncbi:MAG TPA: hypothetical protein GX505_05865 [Clostridiales bacterium]|nr:hypothetical protein [Clostridiales bacterium]